VEGLEVESFGGLSLWTWILPSGLFMGDCRLDILALQLVLTCGSIKLTAT